MSDKTPFWLEIARELQALSQTGLAFCQNEFDKDRYNKLNSISVRILEHHNNAEIEDCEKIFLNQPGYSTPKIDVRSAVVEDGKILLVKERQDGRWSMPGGWADVGDYPSEVAVRETKEESGYDVEPVKIVAVFDANRSGRPLEFFHAFKVIFLCKLTGGEPKHDHEILDVGFFPLDDLPPLSENRTNIKHLNEIKLHLQDINRATSFD